MPMKLYGFWRSLATYRVRAALALKGIEFEQISINLLQGKQHAEEYKAINPQSVVPALVIDGGPPLFQSMAILEYLEETHPRPALLPKDPRGRARVRGLAQIVVSDGHPLVVPRIRGYLEREMHQDEAARNKWLAHWTATALEALEAHLALEVAANPRNDQRMPVAHDDLREAANARPAAGILRQQRRPGMRFLQIFQDRHRLKQRRTAVDRERGHHALRVDRLVVLGVLLPLQQIDRDLFDLDSFEREGGAHPVGGERPPESIEFHSHRVVPSQRLGGTTGTRT